MRLTTPVSMQANYNRQVDTIAPMKRTHAVASIIIVTLSELQIINDITTVRDVMSSMKRRQIHNVLNCVPSSLGLRTGSWPSV